MAIERFKLIPAVYVLLRQDDEVLLLQRANTGYQDGNYSLPAGHLEGAELATAGMVREIHEEIGVVAKANDLRLVHLVHRLNRNEAGQERFDLFFECWDWTGEISNQEPDKCSDLSWYKLNDLPPNTTPLISNVLTAVASGSIYSEYTYEPL